MAYTQEQADALRAAIAKGVTSFEIAGRKVTYRSLDEMNQILGAMEADLATGTRTPFGGLRVHPEYSKGC